MDEQVKGLGQDHGSSWEVGTCRTFARGALHIWKRRYILLKRSLNTVEDDDMLGIMLRIVLDYWYEDMWQICRIVQECYQNKSSASFLPAVGGNPYLYQYLVTILTTMRISGNDIPMQWHCAIELANNATEQAVARIIPPQKMMKSNGNERKLSESDCREIAQLIEAGQRLVLLCGTVPGFKRQHQHLRSLHSHYDKLDVPQIGTPIVSIDMEIITVAFANTVKFITRFLNSPADEASGIIPRSTHETYMEFIEKQRVDFFGEQLERKGERQIKNEVIRKDDLYYDLRKSIDFRIAGESCKAWYDRCCTFAARLDESPHSWV